MSTMRRVYGRRGIASGRKLPAARLLHWRSDWRGILASALLWIRTAGEGLIAFDGRGFRQDSG